MRLKNARGGEIVSPDMNELREGDNYDGQTH